MRGPQTAEIIDARRDQQQNDQNRVPIHIEAVGRSQQPEFPQLMGQQPMDGDDNGEKEQEFQGIKIHSFTPIFISRRAMVIMAHSVSGAPRARAYTVAPMAIPVDTSVRMPPVAL